MKRIIFSFFLLLLLSFQAMGADLSLKKIPSQSVTPSVVKEMPVKFSPVVPTLPAIAKPDLVVQEFKLTPATVSNGGHCFYKLVVRNNGSSSPLKQMLVGFNITPQTGKNEWLAVPGANQSLTFTGQLGVPLDQCGAVSYTVKLDVHYNINVAESNENNNSASYSLVVENRPDVGLCKDDSVCNEMFFNGGVNNQVYIGGEVHNYGCGISPACTLDLNFPEQWPQTIQIPPIPPGKLFAFYTYKTWTNPGVKMGEFVIRNAVNDVRPVNNRVKVKVNIVQ